MLAELLTFGLLFVSFAVTRHLQPEVFAPGQAALSLHTGALNTLLLVAAMAFAAFILGFALPLNAPHSTPPSPTAAASDTEFSGRLVTIDSER
ncbi:MAG: hypothetical protein F9K35_21605 [Burkholderiaceae bacterium]|nr:MAG: hypothetical protein F9K35_21605 [Burkholderiaceae bacterium]